MKIEFTIPGPPQGKARPRVVRMKNGASVSYTPDKTVQYEELVRLRFMSAATGQRFPDDTALRMTIISGFPIAKSKSKKLQAAMLSGAIRPTKKPDSDNIVKIICDALNGFAYKDDAQVAEIVLSKKYVAGVGETFVRIEYAR
ncbi:MAG TPA: RusA family crossover junction endodeoxyribonuclease [Ruminococcaceae bacterium]|nr:RusA family crossover junction endodeoxyribonuclease [Oscillospiraceae bacterium]